MRLTAALAQPGQRGRAVRLAAVLFPLMLISLLVVTTSRAAFTAATQAQGSWSAATVEISQNRGATLFAVDDMLRGDVVQENVEVTYRGSAESVDVKLYGEGHADQNSLAQYLNLRIGATPGGGEFYAGTLAHFASTHTDVDSALGGWDDVSPDTTRDYHFEVELDASATVDQQESTASISFVWEAQSNPTMGQG